jgi:hypothetical protein
LAIRLPNINCVARYWIEPTSPALLVPVPLTGEKAGPGSLSVIADFSQMNGAFGASIDLAVKSQVILPQTANGIPSGFLMQAYVVGLSQLQAGGPPQSVTPLAFAT